MLKAYRKYLFLALFLFIILSLPLALVENLRYAVLRIFSPLWKGLTFGQKATHQEELALENHMLRTEIGKLRALLDQSGILSTMHKELLTNDLPHRRYEEIAFLLGLAPHMAPSRVIYRDPNSWSSFFWIDVGEATNRHFPYPVVSKNSPVLVGRSLVGAIDYVGAKHSRVRLVTDANLRPAVRAVRGYPQNIYLLEHLDALLHQLSVRYDFSIDDDEKENLIATLTQLKGGLEKEKKEWYLAKGIVQGGSAPLWRQKGTLLHGIGFNYDFPDVEGGARDLISGKVEGSRDDAVPILRVGDLLVTTGMDGIFPAGLRVGEVTRIFPLREGDYTYKIEAKSVVGNLDDLQTVFIIPSLELEHASEKRL